MKKSWVGFLFVCLFLPTELAAQRAPAPTGPPRVLRLTAEAPGDTVTLEVIEPKEGEPIINGGRSKLRVRAENVPEDWSLYWRYGTREQVYDDISSGNTITWHPLTRGQENIFESSSGLKVREPSADGKYALTVFALPAKADPMERAKKVKFAETRNIQIIPGK